MANYATDEEQLEAIKAWWRENGRSVVLGVVLALVGAGGWQGWQWYTDSQSAGAAAEYSYIQNQLPMGDVDTVIERAETLRADYAGTTYAVLGALAAARMQVRDNEWSAAADWLEWALDNADEASLQTLARTRLARVVAESGDAERALALLDDAPTGWDGLYAEIRGDILTQSEDYEGAVAAYERALEAERQLTERQIVELKLNQARAQASATGQAADS